MYRKIIILLAFFVFYIFTPSYISSNNLLINNKYYILEDDSFVYIYKNNIKIDILNDIKILDLNDDKLLYNKGNSIYLYDIELKSSIMISESAFNGQINDKFIIYESNINDNFVCKDVIATVANRNCYKLYSYNIKDKTTNVLNLNGKDTYINDLNDNYLVYTSLHQNDNLCSSICSYINIYDMQADTNIIINQYKEINMQMSGNGFIDNNIVFFESFLDVYGCEYNQIFAYDLKNSSIEMITMNDNVCFNSNNELLDVDDGYLIFSSRYNNYDDNKYINYIYSYKDIKFKMIDNICRYNDDSLIFEYNIYCLENSEIHIVSIDNYAPIVNINKKYTALKENKEKLISQIECEDDLSSTENIKIEVLDDLHNVGEQYLNILACDNINNCNTYSILVEIIDDDITPPKIYCQDSIIIKKNEKIEISKYGYAIDNVDGKVSIELVKDIKINKRGNYTILVKSMDTSGNEAYKEIEVKVYDDYDILKIYFFFIFICAVWIVIIYILRFKNKS